MSRFDYITLNITGQGWILKNCYSEAKCILPRALQGLKAKFMSKSALLFVLVGR
jgi:hypothetical protein